jgi:hypothetical protein
MPIEYSTEELVAAYLLHSAFEGQKLQDTLTSCNLRDEVRNLSKKELKKLLEEKYEKGKT